MMGKIKFSKFSMQRLISLYAMSAFMECKIYTLAPKFLFVVVVERQILGIN